MMDMPRKDGAWRSGNARIVIQKKVHGYEYVFLHTE
jgi:hypothetical protein